MESIKMTELTGEVKEANTVLINLGYNGLYNDGWMCECFIDDILPHLRCHVSKCRSGYLHKDRHIHKDKSEEK